MTAQELWQQKRVELLARLAALALASEKITAEKDLVRKQIDALDMTADLAAQAIPADAPKENTE